MRKGITLVTLAGCFIFSFSSSLKARATPFAHAAASTAPSQNSPKDQAPVRTFTGTIAKNGDQFVLNESKTHKLYQLDDQDAASKFVEKNVTITGTLDVVKNIIRIQSIAEAAA